MASQSYIPGTYEHSTLVSFASERNIVVAGSRKLVGAQSREPRRWDLLSGDSRTKTVSTRGVPDVVPESLTMLP